MAYPEAINAENIAELLSRKEFLQSKIQEGDDFSRGYDEYAGQYLRLRPHQIFAANMISPNTENKRFLLMHSAGSGKTLTMAAIAQLFIARYKEIYAAKMLGKSKMHGITAEIDKITPSVFVLGFDPVKTAFIRDLLKYPEFGFISYQEKEELMRRQQQASSGNEEDIKNYKDYHSYIKRRITNKEKGGFFKFFGYAEFVNALFILKDDLKLIHLERIVADRRKEGDTITLEDLINENIAAGKIFVNETLLNALENSIILADEIQMTYNMEMKNNYGIAIQYVLDRVKTLYFVGASATPVNGSPTEFIDVANYLLSPSMKLHKEDYFTEEGGKKNITNEKLDELARLLIGKVSFLQDNDTTYYPEVVRVGEPYIILQNLFGFSSGEELPYLRFLYCNMSDLHARTLQKYQEERAGNTNNDDEDVAEEATDLDDPTIPTSGYSILDAVFPNPNSDTYGLFKSRDIREKLTGASTSWLKNNGIEISQHKDIISYRGSWLREENLAKYCMKGKELLGLLLRIFEENITRGENGGQKTIIFHKRKYLTGATLYQDILLENGFIEADGQIQSTTRCYYCGIPLIEHGKLRENIPHHEYAPAKFVLAHSDIDKTKLSSNYLRFDNPSNLYGKDVMILIGSRVIQQSIDFKHIQKLIIMSVPDSIPLYIQIEGRARRNLSHVGLPREYWRVEVYILVSVFTDHAIVSPEIYRYISKMRDYLVTQRIENRVLSSNAIDAYNNYATVMTKNILEKYFPGNMRQEAKPMLGTLFFEPKFKPATDINELFESSVAGKINEDTYNAYEIYRSEINTIIIILKRLFTKRTCYTLEELITAVKEVDFGVSTNPKLYSERNIIIALSSLIADNQSILGVDMIGNNAIANLFDPAINILIVEGVRYKIKQIDNYFVRFPFVQEYKDAISHLTQEYMEIARSKERSAIKKIEASLVDTDLLVDVQSYTLTSHQLFTNEVAAGVDVTEALKDKKSNDALMQILQDYENEPDVIPLLWEQPPALQIKLLELAISDFTKGNTKRSQFAARLFKMFYRLGATITAGELAKYKEVTKMIKTDYASMEPATVVGFTVGVYARLYDFVDKIFIDIDRTQINRHNNYKENQTIIMLLETSADGNIIMKLRKPIDKIREQVRQESQKRKQNNVQSGRRLSSNINLIDTRMIEKGAVCSTMKKEELIRILEQIGGKMHKNKIHSICFDILDQMLKLEVIQRDMRSSLKYVYGWWDEAINIAASI